jgi:hypothetical protein
VVPCFHWSFCVDMSSGIIVLVVEILTSSVGRPTPYEYKYVRVILNRSDFAGIAGLKSSEIPPTSPSARLLRDWIEGDTFVWLVTDEIMAEYKRVLARLRVHRSVAPSREISLLALVGRVGMADSPSADWF